MADPTDVLTLDDLRMLVGRDIRPALALDSEIEAFLNAGSVQRHNFLSGLVREAGPADRDRGGPTTSATTSPAISGEIAPRWCGWWARSVARAVEEGASDIHLEAQPDEMLVRYRIDGVLRTVAAIPVEPVARGRRAASRSWPTWTSPSGACPRTAASA